MPAERILIVDDSVDTVESLRLNLESDGHMVTCADNWNDASRLLVKQSPI